MKKVLLDILEIDTKIMKIVNVGMVFSYILGVIGALFLLTYNTYKVSYDCFKAGVILTKTAMAFAAQFIACGIALNKIKK